MDIDEDDLLVIKHVLEDAIWVASSDALHFLVREPSADMKRVLEKIQLHMDQFKDEE